MKIAMATACMLAGVAVAAAAAKSGPEAHWKVAVCVERVPGDPGNPAIENAGMMATTMFSRIGVNLEWHDSGACPSEAIRISLSDATPKDLHPGALAYATPYGDAHIVVFRDRIRTNVRPQVVPALTAHVVVHEITHILQGFSRHSSSGLMKAHWSPHDQETMAVMPLPFTAEDIDLIRRGMAWREGLASAGVR